MMIGQLGWEKVDVTRFATFGGYVLRKKLIDKLAQFSYTEFCINMMQQSDEELQYNLG